MSFKERECVAELSVKIRIFTLVTVNWVREKPL